ncbi:hypothetical protein [Gloeomargarita lithophora]|uniref:hypothetical protein n=1 Tax=Gloeomargarita lithophora TaxID=1188228 RepID=UPI0008F83C6A|nr:hypothetical protein [Gloeomargarita lithophora]
MVLTPEQEIEREEGVWDCPMLKREIPEGECYEVYLALNGFLGGGMVGWREESGKTKEEIREICQECAKYRYMFG